MYYPLKLKKFTSKNINKKYIDENLIEELMKKNIRECPYNTFPYIFGNNSKQSQKKYNSGNCVAMSINLQNMLKKHNIKSYLIPATIPNSPKILISVTVRTKKPTAVVKFVIKVIKPIVLITYINASFFDLNELKAL